MNTTRLFMQMLGSFAEFERALIRVCCPAGQIAARARGQILPRVLDLDEEPKVVDMYRSSFFTVDQVAEMLGVKRGAVRGRLYRAGLRSTNYLR